MGLLEELHIQNNPYSQSWEVVVKEYIKIDESKQTFNIADPTTVGSKDITLSELDTACLPLASHTQNNSSIQSSKQSLLCTQLFLSKFYNQFVDFTSMFQEQAQY